MNDRALEDPVENDGLIQDYKKLSDNFLTHRPLVIDYINPDNETPEGNKDCLLKIHLIGDAAGYYDDVYVVLAGGYDSKKSTWYYYDLTGRYDFSNEYGEVVGWRYYSI